MDGGAIRKMDKGTTEATLKERDESHWPDKRNRVG